MLLLVEDDPLVRALTRKLLCEAGYRVLEAESPDAALALASGTRRPSTGSSPMW